MIMINEFVGYIYIYISQFLNVFFDAHGESPFTRKLCGRPPQKAVVLFHGDLAHKTTTALPG